MQPYGFMLEEDLCVFPTKAFSLKEKEAYKLHQFTLLIPFAEPVPIAVKEVL